MKTLLAGLLLTLLFTSCDPNANKQVGDANRFRNANSTGGTAAVGGGSGTGTGAGSGTTPTDAPIDGGLGLLILAGSAYGFRSVKRRNLKAAKA